MGRTRSQASGSHIPPKREPRNLGEYLSELSLARFHADDQFAALCDVLDSQRTDALFSRVAGELERTAGAVDRLHFDVNLTNAVSLSASIAGGLLFGASLIGSVFTGGLAIPVVLGTGSVLCGAGLVAGTAANVVEFEVANQRARQAESLLRPWNALCEASDAWDAALARARALTDKVLHELERMQQVHHLDIHRLRRLSRVEESLELLFSSRSASSPERKSSNLLLLEDSEEISCECRQLCMLLGENEGEANCKKDRETLKFMPHLFIPIPPPTAKDTLLFADTTQKFIVAGDIAAGSLSVTSKVLVPLTVLLLGTEVYFLGKTASDLRKGSKTKLARQMREKAEAIRAVKTVENLRHNILITHATVLQYLSSVSGYGKLITRTQLALKKSSFGYA